VDDQAEDEEMRSRSFRAKPVGWKGESYRHYLASKSVKTNRYMSFSDWWIDHQNRVEEKERQRDMRKMEDKADVLAERIELERSQKKILDSAIELRKPSKILGSRSSDYDDLKNQSETYGKEIENDERELESVRKRYAG
jgi:hypothetical protein